MASLEWDYGVVASAFAKRPPYAADAIAAVLDATAVVRDQRACDVGAGTGNLTLALLAAGLEVTALEPSGPMRALGRERTAASPRVRWLAATAEAMALRTGAFDLVTFGSSFNCVDRARALAETARLLRRDGHLVCLWNHRRRDDPLQASIEARIRDLVPHYRDGARREDQSSVIGKSGLFGDAMRIERTVVHHLAVEDCIEAWCSHLTLRRQAGPRFSAVVHEIGALLRAVGSPVVDVPYVTRAWIARRR